MSAIDPVTVVGQPSSGNQESQNETTSSQGAIDPVTLVEQPISDNQESQNETTSSQGSTDKEADLYKFFYTQRNMADT
ncbi:hypothetical protein Fmac_011426 [Flemingia macrophylla]|uniref:Uncharacterized protein n=1 Tax=Flemingia macrophylla TaxID=520843 RepID=A0ABD1MPI4_9FABA